MATLLDPTSVLSGIPAGLRDPLLGSFATIVRNYREGRWEPSELNGGKLCEVVYTILKGHVDGRIPNKPSKPRNMVDAAKALEQANDTIFPRAVRIQIPRVLVALYEIRNNRGVGHVGGDVDPNRMDARMVLEMSKWMMADLVRVFHNLDTTTASSVVETLVDRTVPIVWEVDAGLRRVLDPSLSMRDQSLLLLYATPTPVKDRDLFNWVECSNFGWFKDNVLKPAHKERLVDYNRATGLVHLSPTGIAEVEGRLPLELKA
jgi:hypothetical protein